jgi:hypothetical protein
MSPPVRVSLSSEAEETNACEENGGASIIGASAVDPPRRATSGYVGLEALWKEDGKPGEEDGSAGGG